MYIRFQIFQVGTPFVFPVLLLILLGIGFLMQIACERQESFYVAQSGLVSPILLPLTQEHWGYSDSPPVHLILKSL